MFAAKTGRGGPRSQQHLERRPEAPRLDSVPKWANMEKPSFTMPANVTGFPAISICTGFGEGGLPVSMQLIGKPFTEPMLFRAAHHYETAMPWRAKRPKL